MMFILAGLYLVGVAVCIPLFFDRDDPWGMAFAIFWPLLVLSALVLGIIGTATVFYRFLFHDTLPPPEDL